MNTGTPEVLPAAVLYRGSAGFEYFAINRGIEDLHSGKVPDFNTKF